MADGNRILARAGALLCVATIVAGATLAVLHSSAPAGERAVASPPASTTTMSTRAASTTAVPASTTTTSLTSTTGTTTPTTSTTVVPPAPAAALGDEPPAPAVTATDDPPVDAPAVIDPVGERCAAALAAVEASGLTVPSPFAFNCPASGEDYDGTLHQGLTSFGGSLADCTPVHTPQVGCYVDINVSRIGSSDRLLRHVVAHEICHAWDYSTTGVTTEAAADACAAAHGFPR